MQEAVQNGFKRSKRLELLYLCTQSSDFLIKNIEIKQHNKDEIGYGIGSESET